MQKYRYRFSFKDSIHNLIYFHPLNIIFSESEAAKSRPPRVKKPGKWDAVMNKIEEGRSTESRPRVKSRVLLADLPHGGSTVAAANNRKISGEKKVINSRVNNSSKASLIEEGLRCAISTCSGTVDCR
jgi:hypothetical protein